MPFESRRYTYSTDSFQEGWGRVRLPGKPVCSWYDNDTIFLMYTYIHVVINVRFLISALPDCRYAIRNDINLVSLDQVEFAQSQGECESLCDQVIAHFFWYLLFVCTFFFLSGSRFYLPCILLYSGRKPVLLERR